LIVSGFIWRGERFTKMIYGGGRNRGLAVATIAEATVTILKAARNSKMIGFNDGNYTPTVPELAISIYAPWYLRLDTRSQNEHLTRLLEPGSITTLFELNIWTPEKKVLNAEYGGSGVDITSFRRGLWESYLLNAAERVPIPVAIKSRLPIPKLPATECSDQFCIVITEDLGAKLRNIPPFDPPFSKH